MQGNIKEFKMGTSSYRTNVEDLASRKEAGILDYIQVPP